MQKLPFETIPQAPAWHHRARVVFRSYFLCFCMQLSCKRFLAKLFLQLLSYGAVAQGCQAKVLGAVWAMLGAVESVSSRCCMQLSRTSCLAALFLALLHGAVMPKLPCRTIPEAVAWSCCSKLALQSYFLTSGMERSCKSCLAKLLLKLLRATVAQRLPCKTLS